MTAKRQALLAEAHHVVDLKIDLRDLATLVLIAVETEGRQRPGGPVVGIGPGEALAHMVLGACRGANVRPVSDYAHAKAILARHAADRAVGQGCLCAFDDRTGCLLTAPSCPLHGK